MKPELYEGNSESESNQQNQNNELKGAKMLRKTEMNLQPGVISHYTLVLFFIVMKEQVAQCKGVAPWLLAHCIYF